MDDILNDGRYDLIRQIGGGACGIVWYDDACPALCSILKSIFVLTFCSSSNTYVQGRKSETHGTEGGRQADTQSIS